MIRIILPLFVMGGFNIKHPIARFFYDVGEVLLMPGRIIFDKLGINTGMIDFSPILSIMLLNFLEYALQSIVR